MKLTFWIFIGRSDVLIDATAWFVCQNELSNIPGVHIDNLHFSLLIRPMEYHITVHLKTGESYFFLFICLYSC